MQKGKLSMDFEGAMKKMHIDRDLARVVLFVFGLYVFVYVILPPLTYFCHAWANYWK